MVQCAKLLTDSKSSAGAARTPAGFHQKSKVVAHAVYGRFEPSDEILRTTRAIFYVV